MIEAIARRLIELSEGQLALQQCRKQLEILSKLRNLQKITIKTLNVMPIIYDLETDIRFLQGKEVERFDIVKNLIENSGFSNEKISEMTKIPLAFIKKVRKELEDKTNGKSRK